MKGTDPIALLVPILERLEIDSEADRNQQIEDTAEGSPQVPRVEVVTEFPEGKTEKEDYRRRDQNPMGGQ